jgi:hypothetical protein
MLQIYQEILQFTRLAMLIVAMVSVGILSTGARVSAAGPVANSSDVAQGQPAVNVALSEAEQAALLYMREEEKLARDVYTVWATTWGEPIFATIAASEQQHMNAVGRLLVRYGLPDPTVGRAAGEYADPQLQLIYDTLIVQGNVSLDAALQTGITIETVDIADLDSRLADTTHNDILRVFNNLRRGSTRHLAAFGKALE